MKKNLDIKKPHSEQILSFPWPFEVLLQLSWGQNSVIAAVSGNKEV